MKLVIRLALIFFGLASGLILSEGLLILSGVVPAGKPAAYNPNNFKFKEPYESNPETGWQLKPGTYELALGKRNRKSVVSIDHDGSRITKPAHYAINHNKRALFIGDSYTFGEGLDDSETLPWQLQLRTHRLNIINQAVGGYGTCQSLLRLKQLIDQLKEDDYVIYGFSSFHEERNVANPDHDYWIAISSPLHKSGYPVCILESGAINIKDPNQWEILLPFTGQLRLSDLVTKIWLNNISGPFSEQQKKVTTALILDMHKNLEKRKVKFIVLLQELRTDSSEYYKQFLKNSGIQFIDGSCAMKNHSLKLPDGHPGAEITKIWAEQINNFLNL